VPERGKTRWEPRVTARVTSSSPKLLARIAYGRVGIAASSDLCVGPMMKKGELVRVLPD
jgi:hypothetical protein